MDTIEKPPHELPALPYSMDALAPLISRETLEYHHGKHHLAYVSKLNSLVAGTGFDGLPLEDIVRKASGPLFNNAAQAWNHAFYWRCLAPAGGARHDALTAAIDQSFGTFEALAAKFKEAAAAKFGAGWTWLVVTENGSLAVRNSDDADNPLRWNQTPLLTCDVWEHAYYIDYRNDRARHIEAFWKLVNWTFVSERFLEHRRGPA